MNEPPTPPRLAEQLLAFLCPSTIADEVVGDLHEEFAGVARHKGKVAARAWYTVQTLRLVTHALRARARQHHVPDPHAQRPGDSIMRSLLTDTRQAFRLLLKQPALAALVVLTLSLGLGANAAIFKVIDALVLHPFTLPDIERLTLIAETGPEFSLDLQETVSPANFADWKKQTDVFEQLAAFDWWEVNLASREEAERVSGFRVTANFFDALGVRPALGRTFTAAEETVGNHHRVVISHDLWQRRFSGDPAILGQTILVDAVPHEIVGITPAGFSFPLGSDIWSPLALTSEQAQARSSRYLTVIGRLRPGKSVAAAHAQVTVVGERLAQQYPEHNKEHGAKVMTLAAGMRDQGLGPIVLLWQASAAFVLLIACANIANLLLARGAERHRELAVRAALGASRFRMMRELLVESLVLACAAVPAALAFAWFGIRLIRINLPPRLVRFVQGWENLDVDLRLMFFTLALAAATAIVFGLLPALRASRPALVDALKDGSRGATVGRNRQWIRRALVVGQVALALPLLVASTLSAMGAQRFLHGAQGYEPRGLLTMNAELPLAVYEKPESRRQFVENVLAKLREMPGVEGVGIVNVLPTSGGNAGRAITVEGAPPVDPANPPYVDYRTVTADLLETMRIPVLRGRGFTPADSEAGQPVVIVSQSLATKHFGETDPLGKRIKLGDSPWLTVVGVGGDVIHNWFGRRNAPTAYRPYVQAPSLGLCFVIRGNGDLASLTRPAKAAVRSVDPSLAVFLLMPMQEALAERTIGLQYVAAIMAVFGAIALVLAVVGVYSLMAFMVTQRTHEIGVRIALGATRRNVVSLTVRQSATMALWGVAIGLVLSFGVGRTLGSLLMGVISGDLRVSLGLAVILLGAAAAAAYIPARRATSIDPMVALRQ
ncbi:MAG TPA: ADOP family duplicated permease [Vicinamibacterales bacterium]|nr:ADOP family duplicated permease [Vicinamibacterales bacterium]